MTLFVGPKEEEMCLFISEARNSAVLYSGCTSTVAGQNWINCYLQTLDPEQKKKVLFEPSTKVFKFGGGETKISKGQVQLPCELAGKSVFVKTDIVDSDILLLLSKSAMIK